MTSVASFVDKLSELSLPNVFNPYRDTCPIYDIEGAPQLRQKNLAALLRAAQDKKVRSIWIARDLGYNGGRRTGLALTDELHLQNKAALFGGLELSRATMGPIAKERTASAIWRMVESIGEPIFMWNAFPFHPHQPDNPMSNRCHTSAERKQTSWVLKEVLDLLEPNEIFTIGRDATSYVSELGVESTAFRHPSYGGQTEFFEQVRHAYKLQFEVSSNKQLKFF